MRKSTLQKKIGVLLVTVALLSTLLTTTVSLGVARHLFSTYLTRTTQMQAEDWATTFAAYYRENGTFAGAEDLFPFMDHGFGYGRMRGRAYHNLQVVLVNPQGQVLFDSTRSLTGQQLSPAQIAGGVPIMVDSKEVGMVLVSGPHWPALNTLESDFINSLTIYSLLIGLATALVAFWLGSILAHPISHPIQALSAATHRVAGGELDVRVAVEGEGEILQLAADFNAMAESLQKTETMRRNLTADIAHELRTPLAVLRSNLESLQSGRTQPSPEVIVSLHDEVIRISKLVKDMETLALAESGHLVLNRRKVQFSKIMDRLTPVIMEIEDRQLQLETELEDGLPEIYLDPDRILQVMLNLLRNTISHSPAGAKIVIRVQKKEGDIQVSVSDAGPGIPEEQLPYIFERFYRADKARSRREGGMGLGLAIAKSYVEAHGGRIWAESTPGQGSTFYFTLPV